MSLSDTILTLGSHEIRLGEVLIGAGVVSMLLLIFILVTTWRGAAGRRVHDQEAFRRTQELETRLAEMAGQLRQFSEATSARDAHIAQRLDDRLDQVSLRLGQGLNHSSQQTVEHLQKLNERLAVIDSAQANLTALSSEMISLKDILANKQARGAYGEARMQAIISDGLPANAYTFQATLSNKTRPDCLIKLPDSDLRIVIDAKFPLEAISGFKEAKDAHSRRQLEQRLRQDVTKHIRDISEKYLIAGETHDSAIMFVPSESIYADLYEHFEDVIHKAHRRNVVIASPNILMLLVQTMQAIFKDARMREQAGLIQTEVRRLLEDVERLKSRVHDLQRHFGQASGDIDKLLTSSDKIIKRSLKIEGLDLQKDEGRDIEAPPEPKLVTGS